MKKIYTIFLLLCLFLCPYPLKAQGTYEETVSYCGDNMQETGLGGTNSMSLGCAAYFTQLDDYTGNQIVRVRLGLRGTVSNVWLFVSRSLDGTPDYEQQVFNLSTGWNEVSLETPFDLDGTPLYVGYRCTVPGRAYSIGMSTLDPCDNGFYLDMGDGFEDVSATYSPLALQLIVGGENFVVNAASIEHVDHVVRHEDNTNEIPTTLRVTNEGAEAISSLTIGYRCDESLSTVELTGLNIARYASGDVTVSLPAITEAGDYDVDYEITAVNGQPNESAEPAYHAGKRLHVLAESFPRVTVIEEFSGNKCGWCPDGIVAFEDLNEKYPDSFIGIAVHAFNASDPMYISEYLDPILAFVVSAPTYVINRSTTSTRAFPNGTDKGVNELESIMTGQSTQPTCARVVSISADRDAITGGQVEMTVTTTFNADMEDAPYALCLVALENDVTGENYNQDNYFAGGDIVLDGWENRPDPVKDWVYDDVAIRMVGFYGIEGSIPSDITAGENYTYRTTLDLSRAHNYDNVELVAIIVNTETGVIANAGKQALKDAGSSVDAVGMDNAFVVTRDNAGLTVCSSQPGVRTYSLYATDGVAVACITASGTTVHIDRPFAPGLYILQVTEDGQTTYTEKIIIP